MIQIEDALRIHDILIVEFGGSSGVRDQGALEAAINRPYGSFANSDLYPTPPEKAAAILQSIVGNHPFVDGNKRTGYVLMRLILLQSNFDIESSEEDKYELVIEISKGNLDFNEILEWIRNHLKIM